MFAATQDEDGNHRLSIRRIRTITHYTLADGERVEIKFKSRAIAKECADYLNSNYEYEQYFDRATGVPLKPKAGIDTYYQAKYIIRVIERFGGVRRINWDSHKVSIGSTVVDVDDVTMPANDVLI